MLHIFRADSRTVRALRVLEIRPIKLYKALCDNTKLIVCSAVIIKGGSFSSVGTNDENASLTIFGGSFEAITCFNFQFSPDDFLADGCAYYDSEGNVLDEYILDSTIYRLSNVTVGKIAE